MAFALIFNVLGIKVLVADDDLGGIKHGGWYVQSDFFSIIHKGTCFSMALLETLARLCISYWPLRYSKSSVM